jgi:hypothetical protein
MSLYVIECEKVPGPTLIQQVCELTVFKLRVFVQIILPHTLKGSE